MLNPFALELAQYFNFCEDCQFSYEFAVSFGCHDVDIHTRPDRNVVVGRAVPGGNGLKAVGIILAIALLIAPGAIAFLITKRFGMMMIVAVAVSLGSSFTGVYSSFFIDSAPAPTIVLVMTIVFIAAFVVTVRRATKVSMGQFDG